MSIKYLAQLSLATVLVATVWIGMSSPARAQSQDPSQILLQPIKFENADVRDAIRQIFKSAKVSYSMAPDVQGSVTLSISGVNLRTALENTLRQVNATYVIDGGVFVIKRYQDVSGKILPRLVLEQEDVREALRQIFKAVDVSYTIDPNVQGQVTLSLRNVTFEVALQNALRQVNSTYRIEAGVYKVVPGGPSAESLAFSEELVRHDQLTPSPVDETVVTQDSRFLYVVRGNLIYKVQKSDLTLVKTGSLMGLKVGLGK